MKKNYILLLILWFVATSLFAQNTTTLDPKVELTTLDAPCRGEGTVSTKFTNVPKGANIKLVVLGDNAANEKAIEQRNVQTDVKELVINHVQEGGYTISAFLSYEGQDNTLAQKQVTINLNSVSPIIDADTEFSCEGTIVRTKILAGNLTEFQYELLDGTVLKPWSEDRTYLAKKNLIGKVVKVRGRDAHVVDKTIYDLTYIFKTNRVNGLTGGQYDYIQRDCSKVDAGFTFEDIEKGLAGEQGLNGHDFSMELYPMTVEFTPTFYNESGTAIGTSTTLTKILNKGEVGTKFEDIAIPNGYWCRRAVL